MTIVDLSKQMPRWAELVLAKVERLAQSAAVANRRADVITLERIEALVRGNTLATPAGSASGEDGLGARIDRLIRLAQANEKIEALQAEVARLSALVSARNMPNGATFEQYRAKLAVGGLTPLDQMAFDNMLHDSLEAMSAATNRMAAGREAAETKCADWKAFHEAQLDRQIAARVYAEERAEAAEAESARLRELVWWMDDRVFRWEGLSVSGYASKYACSDEDEAMTTRLDEVLSQQDAAMGSANGQG